jgi:hypothetical protein
MDKDQIKIICHNLSNNFTGMTISNQFYRRGKKNIAEGISITEATPRPVYDPHSHLFDTTQTSIEPTNLEDVKNCIEEINRKKIIDVESEL